MIVCSGIVFMLFFFFLNRKYQYHGQKIPVSCKHLLSTCPMWAEITHRAASTASSSTSPGEGEHSLSPTFKCVFSICSIFCFPFYDIHEQTSIDIDQFKSGHFMYCPLQYTWMHIFIDEVQLELIGTVSNTLYWLISTRCVCTRPTATGKYNSVRWSLCTALMWATFTSDWCIS